MVRDGPDRVRDGLDNSRVRDGPEVTACTQYVYKGFTKGLQRGVTGSHICWADRHCLISQRKVNV